LAVSETLAGPAFGLRPVEPTDAPAILALRSDPELTRYLPPLTVTAQQQADWISRQRETPGDYYWAIERLQPGATLEGVVGLYGGSDAGFEWGRWILRRGSLGAAASALLVYGYAFEALGAPAVWCQSVVDNLPVVGFHDSCGLQRARILPGRFTIDGRSLDAVEHRLERGGWADAKAYLTRAAANAARLAERTSR
jgi:RimJ/RimL family protein N-acetyltransferase